MSEDLVTVDATFSRRDDGGLSIISVGGIMNAADARARLAAGATLVQVYTGFVYRGPALLTEILAMLEASQRRLEPT